MKFVITLLKLKKIPLLFYATRSLEKHTVPKQRGRDNSFKAAPIQSKQAARGIVGGQATEPLVRNVKRTQMHRPSPSFPVSIVLRQKPWLLRTRLEAPPVDSRDLPSVFPTPLNVLRANEIFRDLSIFHEPWEATNKKESVICKMD